MTRPQITIRVQKIVAQIGTFYIARTGLHEIHGKERDKVIVAAELSARADGDCDETTKTIVIDE